MTAIKQCPDGYATCRRAEATGQWCHGVCQASNPPTDFDMVKECYKAINGLLQKYPMHSAFDYGMNSLGNLRADLGQQIRRGLK